ncbi:unnamed protein product [Ilex paraguariensis]|uniref:Uncharacterized protein n=1 Tax=Ilex paraguariensis TaxID=185542 RepID=A0ABC8RIV7_9AQUA
MLQTSLIFFQRNSIDFSLAIATSFSLQIYEIHILNHSLFKVESHKHSLFKFTRTLIRDYLRRQAIPSTSGSSKVSGTAALSAKEPEGLPFCAIRYALTGIFGSLICSIKAVGQSLLAEFTALYGLVESSC